jgi:hypothetical protein
MRRIIQTLCGRSSHRPTGRTKVLTATMVVLALSAILPLIGASTASANGVPFAKGDVLADVGGGLIRHFSSTGTLLDTLNTTTGTTEGDGMCFDSAGNLYATQGFQANTMSKFDSSGNLLVANFGSGFNEHPESCVFDSADHMYVGQPDGSHEVLKFDTSGSLLASFAPEREDRGTDWLDLASDQCTLHYTSEGTAVKAFNVCTNTQLADFATGLPAPCYAHRILPDGGELVACESEVVRLDSTGSVVQTYNPEPGGVLFALNLDPDGTSFWTAGYFSGTIYRINIATGEVESTFSAGEVSPLGGIVVVGERTCSESEIKLAPLTAENPVGTTHTVTATVTECGVPQEGVAVNFTVTGVNPQTGAGTTDSSGEATFTYKGENAGTDTIGSSFVNKKDETEQSNEVTKIWTKEVGGPEPTTTTTSLSGGGQTGEKITVPAGTAVTDQAALAGANIAKATGTVSYNVYSDAECTKLVASAGSPAVSGGAVGPSEAETLSTPGTYFWVASYSGDTLNMPSTSGCGAEQETVTAPVEECTTAVGEARFKRGKEAQKVVNRLSTNLASRPQTFRFSWENNKQRLIMRTLEKASCKIGPAGKTFRGRGMATVNGVAGARVTFYITVTPRGGVKVFTQIRRGKEVLKFFNSARLGEVIS